MLTTGTQAQTPAIIRALKSYTTLPKAIASRELTEINASFYQHVYGINVYAIEGSDMVIVKTMVPDYINAVDGEIPWVTYYKLFANLASFNTYQCDTNSRRLKPNAIQKNLKKWAKNLKFEAAPPTATAREITSLDLDKAVKAYYGEFNAWEAEMRAEVYAEYASDTTSV
jgi:hypothetical protein